MTDSSRRLRSRRVAIASILAWLSCSAADATLAADVAVKLDFNRDVRPILSDKCFQCHGPDQGKRKAKLRLDTPEGALGVGESGERTLVPGKLDSSELFRRITSKDDSERMPPGDSGKTLSEKDVEKIKTWIEQGAEYTVHWAFRPPVKHAAPAVKVKSWGVNPIDAFVFARLEKEGLSPSPAADPVTIVRRLYLDLIGLPPSIEEVDAYLSDKRPNAYEKLVDRLLDSPRYGERWGRHWLDAARYADSDGYEKDKSRRVWFYRDWVIDAFNRDLPYDRFVTDQIAGDLAPNPTQDQIVATGFLRNSMINEEGGVDPEQFRMEAMFDRMDALGKSVLGLTIQCAQCHHHKYDPISQDDYYRLFAYLNDCHEANVAVYTPEEQKTRAEIFRSIKEIEDDLKHRNPNWADDMAAWERAATPEIPRWRVIRPSVEEISTGGQRYLPLPDGSFLAQGYAPTKHRVKMVVKLDPTRITAFRLELLNDPNLPRGGPGRSIKGTGALTEFEVEAASADAPEKFERIKFVKAGADLEPPEAPLDSIYYDKTDKKRVTGPVAFAIDGKDETAWGTDAGPGLRNQPRKAVFQAEKPIDHRSGTILNIYLKQNHGGWNSDDNQSHNLGRMRLSVTSSEDAAVDPIPAKVRVILETPRDKRTEAGTAAVFSYWRTTVPAWKAANDRIDALWRKHPEGDTQLVLNERDASESRMTHRLERGDFLKPREPVSPGTPAALHPAPTAGAPSRSALAAWLVSRESPTTARAIVNRVWQAYFGTGFVSTSEDLGSQAETPSHPKLFDALAVGFMDEGWSFKKLHKLIVTSETYRQTSKGSVDSYRRDPRNRLLSRGARFRVEAEIVRDVALAASGLLVNKLGGPSVHPPAPEFLFVPPASYGPKTWKPYSEEDRYRRGVYTFRYRSVPYPMMQNFDAPNGDFSCVRRSRSNTPLQALTTLNEPVFLECARSLALLTLRSGGGSDVDRATFAFRRCVSRKPAADELETLLSLLHKEKTRFSESDAKPWDLAATDPVKPPALPAEAKPADLAAWTVVARVLLNLDETITKE